MFSCSCFKPAHLVQPTELPDNLSEVDKMVKRLLLLSGKQRWLPTSTITCCLLSSPLTRSQENPQRNEPLKMNHKHCRLVLPWWCNRVWFHARRHIGCVAVLWRLFISLVPFTRISAQCHFNRRDSTEPSLLGFCFLHLHYPVNRLPSDTFFPFFC